MKAMNKVASHINEMQKIHEEFGAVFDQLILEQSGEKKEVGTHLFSIRCEKEKLDCWCLVHLIGCRSFHGRSASPYKCDVDQSSCLLRKMEERATVGGIWCVLSFLCESASSHQALCDHPYSFFLLSHLVFKTAVVFVCKDGSKQKKKMVCFSSERAKLCFTIVVQWFTDV